MLKKGGFNIDINRVIDDFINYSNNNEFEKIKDLSYEFEKHILNKCKNEHHFKNLLDDLTLYSDYSLMNTLLIKEQYPNFLSLATKKTYKEQGYKINEGVKPVRVLQPILDDKENFKGLKVINLYDQKDTNMNKSEYKKLTKKIVPKEHQEIIIDLYVNKQYGIQKVIKCLKEQNLLYGERVIKRVLQENNVHIRNFNEAKVGCYKMEVPQELQDKIIDLYVNKGFGLDKIATMLQTNFSFDKVRSILVDNGVHIRNVQESAQVKVMPDLRQYQINDNYNFQSHNGAWILGVFAADGYLPITKGAKNRMVLTLQARDEDCL